MDNKLPNNYIVQAVTGACLLMAGAMSSVIIGDRLVYAVCILIEICLFYILIKAIRRRDTPYIYTMTGTMICTAALAILIANIVNRLAALG